MSISARKTIVTAAITGSIHTPSMSPYLPVTPRQIVDDAVRACDAGAAVVHIHARDPETGQPSSDLELMKSIVADIKRRCKVIVCVTTGAGLGMTIEERLRPIPSRRPMATWLPSWIASSAEHPT